MIDTANDVNIYLNKLLVEKNLAKYEEHAEHMFDDTNKDDDSDSSEYESVKEDEDWDNLEYTGPNPVPPTLSTVTESDQDSYSELNESDFECGFTLDDLLELGFIEKSGDETKSLPLNNLDKVNEAKRPIVACSDNKKIEMVDSHNRLSYRYKTPQVCWQQSDEVIVLTITANENVVYNLNVTSEHIIYRYLIKLIYSLSKFIAITNAKT